jgi:nucleotide-binding universal stress UspA family protein
MRQALPDILIPTDGSELSRNAVQYGISLANAANAKVTGVTVTIPFHGFSLDYRMIEDTADSYKKRMEVVAAKYLQRVKDAAKAGMSCDTVHVENEHPYQAIIDAAKVTEAEAGSPISPWVITRWRSSVARVLC